MLRGLGLRPRVPACAAAHRRRGHHLRRRRAGPGPFPHGDFRYSERPPSRPTHSRRSCSRTGPAIASSSRGRWPSCCGCPASRHGWSPDLARVLQPRSRRVPGTRPRRSLMGRGVLQRHRLGYVRPHTAGCTRGSRRTGPGRPGKRRTPANGETRLGEGAGSAPRPQRRPGRDRRGGAGATTKVARCRAAGGSRAAGRRRSGRTGGCLREVHAVAGLATGRGGIARARAGAAPARMVPRTRHHAPGARAPPVPRRRTRGPPATSRASEGGRFSPRARLARRGARGAGHPAARAHGGRRSSRPAARVPRGAAPGGGPEFLSAHLGSRPTTHPMSPDSSSNSRPAVTTSSPAF